MARYLVFDIETRVDKDLVKAVYDPEDTLTLEQAYDKARDRILEQSGQKSDFFPVPYHIPISISTLQADANYRIQKLSYLSADNFSSEKELIVKFWEIFGEPLNQPDGDSGKQPLPPLPTLITFNGRGFDLPVLETRALKFGIPLVRYFKEGYRGNRYADTHHIDLCDYLSNFGSFRRNSLDVLAKLVGLPGKYSIEGEDVEYLHREGRQKEIDQYCMTDVLQTWILFLRTELLRGKLDATRYQDAIAATRGYLTEEADKDGADNFLHDFLTRWKDTLE
jgi:predicted PolB exonuclease-like 3'-5' exonuclease